MTVRGKGNKERIVPMSIELRKALYQYARKHRYSKLPSPYFFCTGNGTIMTYRNAYRDLEAVFEKMGIDKTEFDGYFHMHAMGQTTLEMTQHYVEVKDAEMSGLGSPCCTAASIRPETKSTERKVRAGRNCAPLFARCFLKTVTGSSRC